MSPQPRVVIVLDPRPGALPAVEIQLADGRSLDAVVGARAVAEAGELVGAVTGAAGVVELLAAESQDQATALCLVDGSTLALPTSYGDVVADPRDEPSVLHDDGSGRAVAVRLDGGTLRDPGAMELLARALRVAPSGAALTVLAGAMAAAGRPVREMGSGAFPVHAVVNAADLDDALTRELAVDEAALRLRRASRADDGFLSTFLIRPLSRRLTRRAVAAGLRPDAITGVSCLLGLLAAGAYAGGGLGWRLAGSLLLLVSLLIDCVDGEVARYTRTFTPLGGWLDIGSDRLKEYAVYAGLAWGATPHAWGLASAAFAVLVVRHFVDFGYAATVSKGSATRSAGPVAALSERTSGHPALFWAKRAVVMPVGERTIVLAVLAPIIGARWTLAVLLVAGCIAAAYTFAGRLGRVVHGQPLNRPGTWLAWLRPAGERAVEQGGIALFVGLYRPGALAAAYLLLAAVALHQYDVVYRQRLAGAGTGADDGLLGRVPWPARVLAVAVLTLVLPSTTLRWVLFGLGVLVALAALVDSVWWWRRFVRSGQRTDTIEERAR